MLLDHSVCSRQDGRRNGKPDLLGGFEIDHQLEFRGLLYGQVGRLGSFRILSTYVATRR